MRNGLFVLMAAAALLAAPSGGASNGRTPLAVEDAFTPVVARVITPPTGFARGSDGKYHVAYEVEFQNARRVQATLLGVDVINAETPSQPLVSISGDELVTRLRTLAAAPATDSKIAPDCSRVLFVELEAASLDQAPRYVLHRVRLLGAGSPAAAEPTPLEYTMAPYDVSAFRAFTIGPPLSGTGWVAMNGCCAPGFPHRSSFLPINGSIVNAQRYAIDWMRLDEQGRLVVGDPSKVQSWVGYGADVLAVADGTVTDTLDALEDNVPGSLPDPSTITVKTVDGNHVVIDFGNGLFGFYAHLQRGSVRVKVGDSVKRGDKLGLLGNTGNSSGPHLHFHIMNGPSVIGSEGIPYHIDGYDYCGVISLDVFEKSTTLTENFGNQRLRVAQKRTSEYPLAWTIVNFP